MPKYLLRNKINEGPRIDEDHYKYEISISNVVSKITFFLLQHNLYDFKINPRAWVDLQEVILPVGF